MQIITYDTITEDIEDFEKHSTIKHKSKNKNKNNAKSTY